MSLPTPMVEIFVFPPNKHVCSILFDLARGGGLGDHQLSRFYITVENGPKKIAQCKLADWRANTHAHTPIRQQCKTWNLHTLISLSIWRLKLKSCPPSCLNKSAVTRRPSSPRSMTMIVMIVSVLSARDGEIRFLFWLDGLDWIRYGLLEAFVCLCTYDLWHWAFWRSMVPSSWALFSFPTSSEVGYMITSWRLRAGWTWQNWSVAI